MNNEEIARFFVDWIELQGNGQCIRFKDALGAIDALIDRGAILAQKEELTSSSLTKPHSDD